LKSFPEGFPLPPTDSTGFPLTLSDRVTVLAVDSCARELPADDRARLYALVGCERVIVEFDSYGFAWLAFSADDLSADFALFPSELSALR
jgi:hypothetical protein